MELTEEQYAAELAAVADAYRGIDDATERYRERLRKALSRGVRQVDVATRLGRTEESIRQDRMTEEQREALREAARSRQARVRQRAQGAFHVEPPAG